MFAKLKRSTKAAALIEYVVLVGLIGVTSIFAVNQLGETTRTTFASVQETLDERVVDRIGGGTNNGGGTPGPTPVVTRPIGQNPTPATPITACVDLEEDLFVDLITANTTLLTEGISDCINVPWETSGAVNQSDFVTLNFNDPAFADLAAPLVVNLGAGAFSGPSITSVVAPNGIPTSFVISAVPPAPTGYPTGFDIITVGDSTSGVYLTGPAATSVESIRSDDPNQYTIRWTNGAELLVVDDGFERLDGIYLNGVLSVSFQNLVPVLNFNQIINAGVVEASPCMDDGIGGPYDQCDDWHFNGTGGQIFLDTNWFNQFEGDPLVDAFRAANGGSLTRTSSVGGVNNGSYGGFGSDGSDLERGYWRVPTPTPDCVGGLRDLSGVAPADRTITISYTNGTDVLRFRFTVTPQVGPLVC